MRNAAVAFVLESAGVDLEKGDDDGDDDEGRPGRRPRTSERRRGGGRENDRLHRDAEVGSADTMRDPADRRTSRRSAWSRAGRGAATLARGRRGVSPGTPAFQTPARGAMVMVMIFFICGCRLPPSRGPAVLAEQCVPRKPGRPHAAAFGACVRFSIDVADHLVPVSVFVDPDILGLLLFLFESACPPHFP